MSQWTTMAQLDLLSKIKCKKTYIRKSKMTSGNLYRVTITYNGKKCSFSFNDNYLNDSKKRDFLYCLALDAQGYDNAVDADDFAYTFGYGSVADADCRKVYNACKKQSERLHRLFDEDEIDILNTLE